jgi:general stress protein 26
MTTSEATIKLRELLDDQHVGMLTSPAPSGELHSRPLTLCEVDDDGNLWFFVSNDAEWVRGANPGVAVNVAFVDEENQKWVSVAGTATIHDDEAKIDRLWSKMAEVFFPDGRNDSSIRLLAVDGSTAEYWDTPSSKLVQMAMAAKGLVTKGKSDMGQSGSIDLS